jgi:hypothetical protein
MSYHGLSSLACACLIAIWAGPVSADTAQASFGLNIQLFNPGAPPPPTPTAQTGYCISKSLSQKTNAVVTVVCKNDQFVNIEPRPGTPFSPVSGGAYRFLLTPSVQVAQDNNPLNIMGAGTITTMHIYNEDGKEDTMEMLVSF